MLNREKLKKKYELIISIAITVIMTFSGINFSLSDGGIALKISFGEMAHAATFDPTINIMPIQAGQQHSLSLQSDGTVKSWGYNNYGQLGLGDTVNYNIPRVIPGLTGVKQIATALYQTFALMSDGTVKSWGYNNYGQLGLGDTSQRSIPTVIPGLIGVKQLIAGSNATFALLNDGTVKSWGLPGSGQLGLTDLTNCYSPTLIPNLTGVKQLAAGENHTLALMNDGTVKSWGNNNYGQLGLGSLTRYFTPTVVPGLTGVKQLASSNNQSFALMNDGTAKAWGYNNYGQLGLGNTINYYSAPMVIAGLTGAIQIVAGYDHSLALMNDGTVKAWGYNGNGQLGLGYGSQLNTPTLIPNLTGVRQLNAGYEDSIALMKDSSIKVWGNNAYGQLGLSDDIGSRVVPTMLQGMNFFSKTSVIVSNPVQNYVATRYVINISPTISVSDNNNDNLICKIYLDSEASPRDIRALTNTLTAQSVCFSNINIINLSLGVHTITFNIFDGTEITNVTTNFTVVNFDPTVNIMPIQPGYFHNVSLQSNGTLMSWGLNSNGQLGQGDIIQRIIPSAIPGLIRVKQVASSNNQTFALMNDGTVKAWGLNNYGQLGLGDTSTYNKPTIIPDLSGVKQLVAGANSTYALMNDGTVKAWGYNYYGQLGIGNTTNYNIPTLIPGLLGVKQLVAGDYHALALMNDGTVKSWGYNAQGQLGLGNGNNYSIPTEISGLTGVKQLAAAFWQSFSLMNDGTIKAWGYNYYGQLGLASASSYYTPTLIPNLVGVIQLTTGYCHNLALINDGTVKAWGANDSGELGMGHTTSINTPTVIPDLIGVNQLTAGHYFSMALMNDNTMKIWGRNSNGQLGLGDLINRNVPTVLPNMKFNNKAIESILLSTQNYISTGFEDSILPSISVADIDNDNLTCTYYIDSETSPRDTKTLINTTIMRDIAFNSLNLGSLSQGTHTLTFNVSDGTDTTTVTTSFTINRTGTILASSNITKGTVDLTVNDSFPSTTEYQITCGSKYIDSQGNLTTYPTWLKISNRKITVVGLASGTSYSFQATARNLEGSATPASNTVTVTANTGALASPGNTIAAATSDTTIHLTWDTVSGADSYIVECDGVASSTVTTLYYDNSGLTPNTDHQYRVCAVKGGVSGTWSDYVNATAKITLPIIPQNIVINPSGTLITLLWDNTATASGYDVEVDGKVQGNGNKTTFVSSGLKPLTSHTYRVRAKNIGGAGDWSQLQTVITTGGLPGVITNVKTDISGNSIILNWDPSVDAETYYVVEVVDGVNSDPIDTLGGTTFISSGLNYNSTHTYMVQAVNSIGSGAVSSSIVVTTYGLDTPSNIKVIKSDTSLTLNWDPVKGANFYEIETKTIDGSSNVQIVSDNSGILGTTYTILGLTPETHYTINIKAFGGLGSSAFSSDMNSVTLPTKPEVPTNVKAMITDASVTIRWDVVVGAVGYDVEIDGVVLENDNVLNYFNNSLNLNESHTYRVRVRNAAIAGDWSTLQNINSLPGKPVLPSNVVVISTQTGADISWDPVDAATSYDLEINDGTTTYVVGNLSDTSYIHRRVDLNVECRYRIRTNNVEGTSDWSEYIINNAIKAIGKKNNTLDLGLTATDVTDFTPYTMVVTYNSGVLNVVDLCTITGQKDTTVGKIDGTDITIKEFTPGRIVFKVSKVVNPGEAWTGIVNSIKFMAKANGGTTITYTVFYNPQQ